MSEEEKIKTAICEKFSIQADTVKIQRARRIWLEFPLEQFHNLLKFLYENHGCKILCTITGQDEKTSFSAMYHVAREDGIMINIKVMIPKENPVIKSLCGTFPGGAIYERELVDMFGITVENLPPGNRYPLPENWPANQFPLRKDWNAEMLDKKGEEKS
ncbi:MAG: NADH-quinone oxidoreductase subunit C [Candidatus Riflebacteria bacterium]|nr:NADH-quinone oxidoreductase subunit C [Candidatus Riflebacteria bacterium]